MEMEKNMGLADRIIRPALAAGMIAAFWTRKIRGVPGILLLGLSAMMFATSAIGSCPAYTVLGVDTKSEQQDI